MLVAHLSIGPFHLSGSFIESMFLHPLKIWLRWAPHEACVLVHLQVCEWRSPEQLKQLLDLEMRDTGEPHDRLLELCKDVIRYSVKTSKSVYLPP